MKTAGDLLREKRLARELTLEQVEEKTRIKREYLEAIETSSFANLPSSTFAKGFIKNYSIFLRLNPETTLAMFRRDFTENKEGEIIPRGLVTPVTGKKPRFFTVNLILTAVAITTFLGFLIFQLSMWWGLPKLRLIQPQDGDTYGEKITVKGVAERDATVSVNGQLTILDSSGQFSLDLIFPAGTHTILVEAKNRQGKSTLLERTFTVSK